MPKKTKTKFEVRLVIDRLLNVPYVQGHFFAKVKMMNGNVTVHKTDTREVKDNTVVWNEPAVFDVKIYTDATGLLVPCFVKVSVRRERKGGKSAEKLGVVNIDLTMFASFGKPTEKRYLLQAGSKNTSKKQGKDNSVLQISVGMQQSEGAPVFRSISREMSGSTDGGEDDAGVDPRASQNRVDMEELEDMLYRLHEASTDGNVGLTALPEIDPHKWMRTREDPGEVVESVMRRLGPPKKHRVELVPVPGQSWSGGSGMGEAFLKELPKVEAMDPPPKPPPRHQRHKSK